MTDRFLSQAALADLADVPATSRWTSSGDLRLHLLDYGGERPPLVILPGITTPAVCMDFVARELTDLVRPYVLDIRGRGFSDSADTYTLDDYAADTEAVVSGLGLDNPILLGHSMGARIAAAVAARGKVATRGSLVVDPPMSGPGRGPYPTTMEIFARQLDQALRGTTAAEVAQSWPRWPAREQGLRARWLASCAPEAIAATHHGFEHDDFFDTWPRVPAPTVLIHGADSPVVTAAGAEEAAGANAAARLRSIPDSGHMVYWDNPQAALEITRAALRELLAG